MFINSGWANNCGDELFTIGWVSCLKIVKAPESGGGKAGSNAKAFSAEQLLQVQREDEEIISIVTLIGKILL